MTIRLKRFDTSIPLPEYKTPGAAAFDLSARVTTKIKPQEITLIPLNVAIELPEGYIAIMAPRSSTHKLGIMMANSIGVFDPDYKGDNDEYLFAAYNFTTETVTIEKGTRIAQLVILPQHRITIEEVVKMGHTDRGGFGSTGNK